MFTGERSKFAEPSAGHRLIHPSPARRRIGKLELVALPAAHADPVVVRGAAHRYRYPTGQCQDVVERDRLLVRRFETNGREKTDEAATVTKHQSQIGIDVVRPQQLDDIVLGMRVAERSQHPGRTRGAALPGAGLDDGRRGGVKGECRPAGVRCRHSGCRLPC
jgi:hypothetical protein